MKHGEVTLEIYLAHRGALVNYANAITGDHGRAEDVVQEAFLRYQAASARGIDEPVGYLYRIVRNLALDLSRRLKLERRHVVAGLENASVQTLQAIPTEATILAREDLRNVMEALSELPERTRIALEMHRFGGCKLKDIADHLDISLSYAQALVKEGLKHCQRKI